MSTIFKAIALDVDGTIAFHDNLSPDVLAAMKQLRYAGMRIIVVTGRTLAELDRVYPQLAELSDIRVLENGAVMTGSGGHRLLATRVPQVLRDALTARGIQTQSGEVLLACSAEHAEVALQEVTRLGVGCVQVRNRGELMILPANVTKGTGLWAAVEQLGLSLHNVLAMGDAENDHPLFSAAEFAVAVADAMPAVREHADLVLPTAGPRGTAEFITGPIATGRVRAMSRRRFLPIGKYHPSEGHPGSTGDHSANAATTFETDPRATIPGSQATVLVTGVSGRGKSYAAGLIAERAVQIGYQVLVIDPEGDHSGLGSLHQVELISAVPGKPFAEEVIRGLSAGRRSVVLNTAALSPEEFAATMPTLASAVEELREASGFPHWVIMDEAHTLMSPGAPWATEFNPAFGGYCLVSYVPDRLIAEVLSAVDVVLSVTAPVDVLLSSSESADGSGRSTRMIPAPPGSASLLFVNDPGPARRVQLDQRSTSHIRHLRKYGEATLPLNKWFWFKTLDGSTLSANSLIDFEVALSEIDAKSLEHHLCRGDFSRWIRGTLQDTPLADAIAAAERESVDNRRQDLEKARDQIRADLRKRYLRTPAGS